LPAVIITGDMREAQRHAAGETHPILWLQKPVSPERLHHALTQALRAPVGQS
jgi:CheY-like chemotaxis protein